MWAVELWVPEFIAKSPSVDLEERIARLPEEMKKLEPDVVIFEEVWSDARAEQIKRLLKPQGYVFSAAKSANYGWFFGGGNGLLIVSKLKLDSETQAMSFSTSTRWNESKFICRKGAIKTRVEVEPHAWVDLYATHLGASGLVFDGHKATSFLKDETAAQLAQAKELVAFIKQTRTSPDMILAADLNSHPYIFEDARYSERKPSEVYRLMTCESQECGHLEDSAKNAKFFTYDTLHNSYANHADFANEPEGRIDYVFTQGESLTPKSAKLAFTEKPLSDHYGLSTTITYAPKVDLRQALRLPSSSSTR
jgi:endonuclease/exonuclease/phosphatase family metal-dependent hydrolase